MRDTRQEKNGAQDRTIREVGPLVSVVIPAFNNAHTISATLRSVSSQTYGNLEVIVSDHASSDDTRARTIPFLDDPRFSLHSFNGPRGAHWNWNFASSLATGEFLALVCGDDILHPEAIEAKVLALSENPSAVMASNRRSVIDAAGRVLIRERGLGSLAGFHSGEESVRACIRAGSNLFGEPMCVMFRRQTFEEMGGWETDLPYVIDQATYFKVLIGGDFVGVPEVLASFRVTRTQLSYRLVSAQSSDVKALHRKALKVFDFSLSRKDLLLGDINATANGWLRRFLYKLI